MIKLKIKKELYAAENIKKARDAYKGIANIIVLNNKEHYIIRFLRCKYDENRTVQEFENYLIGLENMQI